MACRPFHISGFIFIVDFFFQGPGKLLNDLYGSMQGQFFDMMFRESCQMQHNFKVNFNYFADAGSLKFDRHHFAVL